jgi:hypothetical protein
MRTHIAFPYLILSSSLITTQENPDALSALLDHVPPYRVLLFFSNLTVAYPMRTRAPHTLPFLLLHFRASTFRVALPVFRFSARASLRPGPPYCVQREARLAGRHSLRSPSRIWETARVAVTASVWVGDRLAGPVWWILV